MPSEKYAGGWGSDDDEMRMITVSFVRAIERFAGALALHFLPLFQQVVAIRKTRNQLISSSATSRIGNSAPPILTGSGTVRVSSISHGASSS